MSTPGPGFKPDMIFDDHSLDDGENIHEKKKIQDTKKYPYYTPISPSSDPIFLLIFKHLSVIKRTAKHGNTYSGSHTEIVWTEMNNHTVEYRFTPTTYQFIVSCFRDVLMEPQLIASFPFSFEEIRFEGAITALSFNFNILYVQTYDYSVRTESVIATLKQAILPITPNDDLSKYSNLCC
jgi:hypothetical protein